MRDFCSRDAPPASLTPNRYTEALGGASARPQGRTPEPYSFQSHDELVCGAREDALLEGTVAPRSSYL